MKQKLLILFIVSAAMFAGCKKEQKDTVLKYPKTELAGTTWKRFSFKPYYGGNDVYKFMKFSREMTVEIYSADSDGSDPFSSETHPYKVTTSEKNMDSFEVFLTPNLSGSGFTTLDINKIEYSDYTYDRVK